MKANRLPIKVDATSNGEFARLDIMSWDVWSRMKSL